MDPPEEIRANKLAALIGRGETKDLVDLRALERAGFPALDGLADAQRKDRAVEPATLAWVLGDLRLRVDDLLLVEPVDRADLERFRDDLVRALRRGAFPAGP